MEHDHEMTSLRRESDELTDANIVLPANSGYELDISRLAALAEVDNAKMSWTHTKVCLVAGVGFFTDAYDLFAINIAATMLGYVYGEDLCKNNCARGCTNGVYILSCKLTAHQDLGLKVAAQVGTLFGQLLFGWLADILGRKKMYGFELLIIIIATFGQAVAANSLRVNIFGILIVWRFFMGLGIGGDYPLSAVISSEFAATKIRGRMMSAVFAFQGFGNFFASIVAVIITTSCKHGLKNGDRAQETIDFMWRLFIGLGAVPAVLALYFRLTIPETPRFTMDVKRNLDKAMAVIEAEFSKKKTQVDKNIHIRRINIPQASWRDFTAYFGKLQNLKVLFGTSYSWFALDISFYGLGLNATNLLQESGFAMQGLGGIYDSLHQICIINLVLSLLLLPGYAATFRLIDTWGRKPIQFMGFTVLSILFLVFGFGYDKFTPPMNMPTFNCTNLTSLYTTIFTSNCTNTTSVPMNMPTFSCTTITSKSLPTNIACRVEPTSRTSSGMPASFTSSGMKASPTESGTSASSTPHGSHFIRSGWAIALLYCLAGFFENFGPNVTTFVIPGEVFPTRYRSTAHGISAASGKFGSIIAQIIVSRNRSAKVPFQVFAFFMMSGIASTYLLPETKGRSLEELSNEDQVGFVRDNV